MRFFNNLSIITVCLFFAIPLNAAAQEESKLVEVKKVKLVNLKEERDVTGRFVALKTGVVSARVAGPIKEIYVEIGDRIKKGFVIATIEDTMFDIRENIMQANIKANQASMLATEKQLSIAKQVLQRLEKLKSSPAFSKATYDDHKITTEKLANDLEQARAALDVTIAQYEQAAIELNWTKITAPYDGVVSALYSEIGAWIDAGNPIVELINDQEIEIEVDIPGEYVIDTDKNMKVKFLIENAGNKKHNARLRSIVPYENPLTHTRTARFIPLFDKNKPANIVPNQSVIVKIQTKGLPTLLVHKDAVIADDRGYRIFLYKEGQAVPRYISIGNPIGSYYVVKSGLIEEDIVVTRGNERLIPGQKIYFQDNL